MRYPTLNAEIARRGIKKSTIASCLGISARSLYNKLNGTAPFTWDEVCSITSRFFPDMSDSKDELFKKEG